MRSLILLSLTAAATAGAAEPRDATAHVERVGDGVYVILHDDATDEWPHGNTGVIVGDDGVLVVDSDYLPSRARADVALIKALTPRPVRTLVITHWHFDHNNGTVAYRDAYPGLTVVAERESAHFIELNGIYWAKMSTAPGSARRAALAKLEADHSGTPEEQRRRAVAVRQRKAELEELATLQVVTPNLTFDGQLELGVGKRRVVLQDRGRGNSPHDVTIYLPDEQILFTGDLVVQSPLPYTGGSWPVPWIGVLRALEATPTRVLVPGHGPVMRDHAYTRQVRGLLEAVTTRVERMVRDGRTLEQVQAEIALDDLRQGAWAARSPQLDDDWKETMAALVERAWRGVRGNGG